LPLLSAAPLVEIRRSTGAVARLESAPAEIAERSVYAGWQ
jgi:hypothetical protein